jgi:hypothetical protein
VGGAEGLRRMAVEEAAESCGSHAAAAASGGGAAELATSSSSAAAAVQARKQQQQQRHKLEVYTEVLRRLHDAGLPDARAPGFDDELWNHFNRLPARCVLGHARDSASSSDSDVARMQFAPTSGFRSGRRSGLGSPALALVSADTPWM